MRTKLERLTTLLSEPWAPHAVQSSGVGSLTFCRTSIVFSLKDKPGELQKSFFQPFAEARVNLTKIESRPSKERPWEYLFFVDFVGHREEKHIRNLLDKVAKNCVYMKVLGSYPIGRSA